jgi:hypothetical protein
MDVDRTRRDDELLSGNNFGRRPNDELGVDTVHNIRVARFAYADNDTVLDTDVCLVDFVPVDDECICDDQVQRLG